MVTMSQHFGGGVGFTGNNQGYFDPRRERVIFVESGYTLDSIIFLEDVSGWPPVEFLVINNKGSSVSVESGSGSYIQEISNGYVGVFKLKTPNNLGGSWVFREYQYNNVGRVHGESSRIDTIDNVISANARPTISSPDCNVYVLTNCEDGTDVLFSRQDWSDQVGGRITFTFESSITRVVTIASTITKPVDTRDLLSFVSSSIGGGCDAEINFTYTFSRITVSETKQANFTYTFSAQSLTAVP